ncbi:hypothetical protein BR93DRAFT_221493 [Coniochaeta sp. PMI_546]|nr:hypothetical protein BR93DRAFT_221493 [Coniochaeta sp. PMI_546]
MLWCVIRRDATYSLLLATVPQLSRLALALYYLTDLVQLSKIEQKMRHQEGKARSSKTVAVLPRKIQSTLPPSRPSHSFGFLPKRLKQCLYRTHSDIRFGIPEQYS